MCSGLPAWLPRWHRLGSQKILARLPGVPRLFAWAPGADGDDGAVPKGDVSDAVRQDLRYGKDGLQ